MVQDMASWFHWCGEHGLTAIGELDCKEQFNNVPRTTVVDHMTDCTDWLAKRCRWHATELLWSVHHTHARLDQSR